MLPRDQQQARAAATQPGAARRRVQPHQQAQAQDQQEGQRVGAEPRHGRHAHHGQRGLEHRVALRRRRHGRRHGGHPHQPAVHVRRAVAGQHGRGHGDNGDHLQRCDGHHRGHVLRGRHQGDHDDDGVFGCGRGGCAEDEPSQGAHHDQSADTAESAGAGQGAAADAPVHATASHQVPSPCRGLIAHHLASRLIHSNIVKKWVTAQNCDDNCRENSNACQGADNADSSFTSQDYILAQSSTLGKGAVSAQSPTVGSPCHVVAQQTW